ncbi:Uncharacterised protein [Mycobacteroides abscessus subsp. abscessus]|nr:Uncharacterised protein [Mycobacteroides abscessus subsp. abscessus]
MDLTPTDWSTDVRERFKIVDSSDDPAPYYPYSHADCGLCRRIVEPIALHLAVQDDWLYLDDVKLLTGFQMTTAVAVFDLINKLHPDHPAVLDSGHHGRLLEARNVLHEVITAAVLDAVTQGGEFNPRVLGYVQAWSGTYADTYLEPSGWSPPYPLGPPDVLRDHRFRSPSSGLVLRGPDQPGQNDQAR